MTAKQASATPAQVFAAPPEKRMQLVLQQKQQVLARKGKAPESESDKLTREFGKWLLVEGILGDAKQRDGYMFKRLFELLVETDSWESLEISATEGSMPVMTARRMKAQSLLEGFVKIHLDGCMKSIEALRDEIHELKALVGAKHMELLGRAEYASYDATSAGPWKKAGELIGREQGKEFETSFVSAILHNEVMEAIVLEGIAVESIFETTEVINSLQKLTLAKIQGKHEDAERCTQEFMDLMKYWGERSGRPDEVNERAAEILAAIAKPFQKRGMR